MSTFVLVPGAWLGGWAWQGVTSPLRYAGHDVHPVTLTGLGDRSHLARPEIDAETHVADIVNTLRFEDLRDAILVAHSYAGLPVTGAADRVPERIFQVVYLDSGPFPNGMTMLDAQGPEARDLITRRVAEAGDGWRLPMPGWDEQAGIMGASTEGLGEDERRLVEGRAVDQPYGTYTQPLRLTVPAGSELPKALVTCSYPLDQVRQMIDSGHLYFTKLAGPQWRLFELPTGHWPMFSRPADTARLLAEIAKL